MRSDRKRGKIIGGTAMANAINTQGTALASMPLASGSRFAAACVANVSMPAERHKRTMDPTGFGGSGGGATDVVGADDERYEGVPGRGGPDDGGGTNEGGSVSIAGPAASSS